MGLIQEHLVTKTPVSDICDKYGIHLSVYYRWQQFFEGGEKVFSPTNEGQEVKPLKQKVTSLEVKQDRKDEVLGKVVEEHVTLKKVMRAIKQAMGHGRNVG